ncbi:WecB/TagA/CpsF family glycosyltransferase [Mongoliitalea daihaiensis]|uniref:WecB/TagA/CpsF family glycosyltransferase n=1 Tax=Mongoliitalea daihaiensis TaxID=2782006 RepID=UPI001F411C4A|nr:WecB/TagA/CpsF family glycosyltransferase [Mongoliitalea daihaiensis]UJP63388.1 WecB/TagA/CpsF family glycosyltransferase [Mongoliitalea daihaiensis]
MKLFGYEIRDELPNIFSNKKIIVNTINPHSYCVAKSDSIFRKSLLDSDYLIPDGIGIVLATKFIYGKRIKKISGFDLHKFTLEIAEKSSAKVFYLGATENTLLKIKSKVNFEYPNIQVGSFSPPFKPSFTKEENQLMLDKINSFNTDVLFVGMTAPKQEKWIQENKDKLNVKFISGIGAVFDFYAGTVERPSKFWIDLGLEWLPRLIGEPRRLWKRNFISTPEFIFDVIKLKLLGTSNK